ncbi:hypothetical protein ACFQ0X_43675 [Streptomyces rectiviolaceus]|uniref:Terminase small subunit n=1 Tax=Streptomyces rectiviolaceus TaxID=332591 RepID=A0ABP6NNN4_9ACTN
MPPSKATQALVAERRAKLLKLRIAGISFHDQRVLDLGYESRGHASKDLLRALKDHREEEAAAVDVYRQQENERLDALLEAAWPRATKPSPVFDKEGMVVGEELDMRAVDTVLRLMDRRAKLNGLDMPVKTEVTGADGGPLQLGSATSAELEALIGISEGSPTPDDAAPVPTAGEPDDGAP